MFRKNNIIINAQENTCPNKYQYIKYVFKNLLICIPHKRTTRISQYIYIHTHMKTRKTNIRLMCFTCSDADYTCIYSSNESQRNKKKN